VVVGGVVREEDVVLRVAGLAFGVGGPSSSSSSSISGSSISKVGIGSL
jgi:hypothetical protein